MTFLNYNRRFRIEKSFHYYLLTDTKLVMLSRGAQPLLASVLVLKPGTFNNQLLGIAFEMCIESC